MPPPPLLTYEDTGWGTDILLQDVVVGKAVLIEVPADGLKPRRRVDGLGALGTRKDLRQ